jgi:PhnB protein
MMKKVHYIPEGYHTVTPYLIVQGAAEAIEFYKKAFGATEVLRMEMPGNKVGHAEIQIGDSRIMLGDECPQWQSQSPLSYKGTPVTICLYIPDVDGMMKQAVDAGAKVIRPLQDQFYGDRTCAVEDPFGHHWHLATHQEDLSPEEIKIRMENWTKQQMAAKS